MKEPRKITIADGDSAVFNNNVDYCVGTGRIGLALSREYMDELRFVQEHIGFSHIRGHGLFSDDMSIYHEYRDGDGNTRVEYNFTYLDRVFDDYHRVGIRPFLELGFMPSRLASGTQTLFYWRANTTPPRDYDAWCALVTSTLSHLVERYGDEAYEYPIEVWNEPNLPGFWEHADMKEYFRLFKSTFTAIKALDGRFRVGGPAVCGGTDEKWIRAFLEFCRDEELRPDFVTRHHYTIEQPEEIGHYAYAKLMNPEYGFANLQTSRDIIDSFDEFRGLPIHITEFNSSYTPKGVIHDTNLNAACIAQQLSRLGDVNESYSYWTFGDVFEELGVPYSIFHGGFGLVAEGCVPKPTFWTFAFYKKLKCAGSDCVHKDDNCVVVRTDDGGYAGIMWNIADSDGDELTLSLALPGGRESCLMTQTVDEDVCDPLRVWHDMGEHPHPDESELRLLRDAATPLVRTERIKPEDGTLTHTFTVGRNGVVYFELRPGEIKSDRGYDYERTVGQTM